MGLITKEIEIKLFSSNFKYYKNLGYDVPTHIDKHGKEKFSLGEKIIVNVKDLPINSSIIVRIKCDNCGIEKDVRFSHYNKYNHNGKSYCHKCGNKIFNSGKNNNKWNEALSEEERKNDRSIQNNYRIFVSKVLARDNYTCKCCGKKQGDIEVHHLNSYDWDIEHRTDETNGTTLCKSCHKNFHIHYGYGNNTKEQFEEWFGKAVELAKYEGELPTTRKIYCIEENKIYDSATQLMYEWNYKSKSHVYNVCNRKKNNNGSYCKTINNKHILWYDDYITMSEEDIAEYIEWTKTNDSAKIHRGLDNGNCKRVKCITTGKEFNSITLAGQFYDIKSICGIGACCRDERKSCGKYNGIKLQWEYI